VASLFAICIHLICIFFLQKIYNSEKFGGVKSGTYVIVIQVHSRVEYLSLLIDSLSRVTSIENALIIFSHDLFIPELNDAIRHIDFAPVMQIFYPDSLQLNPNSFPGQSPDDCPRDVTINEYVPFHFHANICSYASEHKKQTKSN